MKKQMVIFVLAALALNLAPASGRAETEKTEAAPQPQSQSQSQPQPQQQQQFAPGAQMPPWAMRGGPGMMGYGDGYGYGGGTPWYGGGMAGYWMPPGMMGYSGMMPPSPYSYDPMFRPYGMTGGPLVGYPAQQLGFGPGMIAGLSTTGMISSEVFQKFFDETKETRKQIHDIMFDYIELLRTPNYPVEKRVEMENKIQALRQKIYEKAPRYQF